MEASYINTALDELLMTYLNDMSSFFIVARIIAGLGLLVSTYFTFFQIMGGSDEGIKKYLTKFLLIFLGIVYYPTFILVINYPLDLITESARSITVKDIERIEEVKKLQLNETGLTSFVINAEDEAEFNAMFPNSESQNDEVSFFQKMATGAANITNDLIGTAITGLLSAIAELAIIILNIIRGFFLIVLSVFGVFVIALSAFPTLEGSFTQWLTKYINVYLWLAIGFILQSVLVKVQLLSSVKLLNDSTNASNATNQWNLLISVCTIIGFLAIPTISGWMVNAATNSVGNKMGQSVNQAHSKMEANAAAKAAKAAKAGATGGASAVI
jgi:hypothetical protein